MQGAPTDEDPNPAKPPICFLVSKLAFVPKRSSPVESVSIGFGNGFSDEESHLSRQWRWSDQRAQLWSYNDSGATIRVAVEFTASTHSAGKYTLRFSGPIFEQTFEMWKTPSYRLTFDALPGRHRIDVDCTAPPFDEGSRRLSFAIYNPIVRDP